MQKPNNSQKQNNQNLLKRTKLLEQRLKKDVKPVDARTEALKKRLKEK